jgi:hypothetical protein
MQSSDATRAARTPAHIHPSFPRVESGDDGGGSWRPRQHQATSAWKTGMRPVERPQRAGKVTKMVPRKGLEPSRPLSHWHLKPARLPIPPPGHVEAVSTDRSRACQIDAVRPKYAIQARPDGVSRIRQFPRIVSRICP